MDGTEIPEVSVSGEIYLLILNNIYKTILSVRYYG